MRVLLLSSFEPNVRPDTDLGSVLVDLLASLERQPGCEVTHREITSVADIERAVADLGPRVVWTACETPSRANARMNPPSAERSQLGFKSITKGRPSTSTRKSTRP